VGCLRGKLGVVEGFDVYNPVEICLVSDIMAPKKFSVPKFVKYMGLECPNIYLRSYYNKMVEVIGYEKLFIHFFQDSLTDSALS
jgi:hypothetical protein